MNQSSFAARLFAVAVGSATLALACSSSDTPATGGTSSGGTSSGGTSSGGTSSGGVDGGADTGADTGGGGADAGGCQTTGGLAAPPDKQVNLVATFSEPTGGYAGGTDPFASSTLPGDSNAVRNPNETRFLVSDQKPIGDPARRTITVALEPAQLVACSTHVAQPFPATKPPYVQYAVGNSLWFCPGNVIVDTVAGMAVTFHFDLVCKSVPSGTTTVRMAGKGSGTLYNNL